MLQENSSVCLFVCLSLKETKITPSIKIMQNHPRNGKLKPRGRSYLFTRLWGHFLVIWQMEYLEQRLFYDLT